MKFKSAYEYIESLYKAEKLIGLEIGLQREFTIIGELAEQDIQVLNNIWGSYYHQYSGSISLSPRPASTPLLISSCNSSNEI